jgi:hypothetical protein
MKNEFGKNYEYIDDYIESSLRDGKALLYQMLVDMKTALIKKDETIRRISAESKRRFKHNQKQLQWLQEKDKRIDILKKKLKEFGIKL